MKEKNIRKLSKAGRGTVYVTLPKYIVESLGWREHQKLVVSRVSRGILIKDWRKK